MNKIKLIHKGDGRKKLIETSHLDDLGHPLDTEFVKPLKISPPQNHEHDLGYEESHNKSARPPLRHHSGHFRHKLAEVWDPHPHYEISAFGHTFRLELTYNNKFVSPDLHITHIWSNYSERVKHDPRTSGCFYTGVVKGDSNSDVAVSLCNGMTGYIRTSEGNYYIEPAEEFQENMPSKSILHRMRKVPHRIEYSNNVDIPESGDCETKDSSSSTVIDDDYTDTHVNNPHKITKREIRFDESDYLDGHFDDFDSDYMESISRTLQHTKRKKRAGSNEYFVEVLIVADRNMALYHKTTEDLIHYILTLMSHVVLLYKDASIGNAISLAVVDIMTAKEEFLSSTSEDMLKEFCQWQRKHTIKHQHDTAVLLTREPICRKPDTYYCNTIGIAEVGAMCNPNSSCAVVRDKGLSTSYTIAHEIGHVLNMPHDDNRKCARFSNGVKQSSIMSDTLRNGTKPWLWSACSKHYLTEFLDSSRSGCLLEAPNRDILTSKPSSTLPGEIFEVNRQCELEFGIGSKKCSYMPPCQSLWCTDAEVGEEGGCRTQYMLWADGTSCGYRRWCRHGECVPFDREMLTPVAGGWGPWQGWGACSRTCGGGIRIAKRACDSPAPAHGGAYCTGKSVKYESCNTQSCSPDAPDFRDLQCAEFNGDTKGLRDLTPDVRWVAKYEVTDLPEDLCKLYCKVADSSSYYLLKEKVIDGTKCDQNSFDICVNGICRKGGCDNYLDSNTTLDECGVCGGDNSQCEEITGVYNISRGNTYSRVVRIPRGSSNILVQQRGRPFENYIALVDGETGKYILNGDLNIVVYEKDIDYGGMTIKYNGSERSIVKLSTPKTKRLTKDLIIEVLSVGDAGPPDITYRYTIVKDKSPRYAWRLYQKKWSECNSICSGTQFMRPSCVELALNAIVKDSHCSKLDMTGVIQQRDCNTHCQVVWNVMSRGQCSAHCGNGHQEVFYNCVKIDLTKQRFLLVANDGSSYGDVVDNKHCAVLQKPSKYETCYGPCDKTSWDYGEWSECTKTCGTGIQRRTAKCVTTNQQILEDIHCKKEPKITEQSCNPKNCPVWSLGEWSPCSVTCGKGYRTRSHYCHIDGRLTDDRDCGLFNLPVDKEECQEKPCVRWHTGFWSKCSSTCGGGVETRDVFCETFDSTQVEDSSCRELLKPNSTRICFNHECIDVSVMSSEDNFEDNSVNVASVRGLRYRWITGAWNQCSKSCNSGRMSRAVVCRNELGEENSYMCDYLEKPINSIECNTHPCPSWNYGAWTKCDEYCEKHRQVSCQTSRGMLVNDDECDVANKPVSSQKCRGEDCSISSRFDIKDRNNSKRYKWKIGKWTQCSKSCGRGQRTRQIWCKDSINDVSLVDQYCSHLKRPKDTKTCERLNCAFTWLTGEWSQCSRSCDEGVKHRNVTCHKVHQGGYVDPIPLPEPRYKIHKNFCDIYNKPAITAKCIDKMCTDIYSWMAGPWQECSHPCGRKGRQIRKLYCINREGRRVQRHLCPRELKPPRKQKCNQFRCLYRSCLEVKLMQKTINNKDYVLSVRGKPALVYCYKMDTNEPEEYISLQPNAQNYAEMYDRRLREPNSCPYSGARRDTCDCMQLGPDRSGLTNFWKVRLNMTSLQIIGDVFTFSNQKEQKGERKIPYGTAGDCYSERTGCPQGRFSVDLTGTSFRISRKTRWSSHGNHASKQVHSINEQKITGRCGGYCGECAPDPSVGLLVEVT